ncbi:MAG: hypothetical protein LBT59_16695 [Clostridiales bacterium]|nr:hypothetical protein [Clostridiales bacterium]
MGKLGKLIRAAMAAVLGMIMAFSVLPPIKAYGASFTINGSDVSAAVATGDGLTFKGFGVLSGNSTSNLLMDYKAEHPSEYWSLIEELFGGEYPIMTHVKIEMGSDGNNSTGADSATMRGSETTADASRSPGLQLAADAKSVNPDTKVSGLRWRLPQGISAGTDESFYNWYRQTIFDCYEKYGFIWDYINPDTNETSTPDVALIKWFKGKLVGESSFPDFFDEEAKRKYHNIKIIASDENNGTGAPISIANSMTSDPSLKSIIDAIGSHYSTGNNNSVVQALVNEGKEAWYSEASASFSQTEYQENQSLPSYGAGSIGGKSTPLSAVDTFMAMMDKEYKTHAIFQPAIGAFYHSTQYDFKEYIQADEPWAGFLHYDESMYLLRHFTDFAKSGWGDEAWRFIPEASYNRLSPSGGHASNESGADSYVTLAAPDGSAFSTIFVNNSSIVKDYSVSLAGMSIGSSAPIEVWLTTKDRYEELISETNLSSSSFTVQVPAYSAITVTSLDKSSGLGSDRFPQDGESLPLDSSATGRGFDTSDDILYFDDFSYSDEPNVPVITGNGSRVQYTPYLESRGSEPRYMVDGSGAFRVESGVLRQLTTARADEWNSSNPKTLIGDHKWMDYSASVDVTLTSSVGGILGVREQTGQTEHEGYNIRILNTGAWSFYDKNAMISSGSVGAKTSYTLKVSAIGSQITAYVDGVEVASTNDTGSNSLFGRVLLGCTGWNTCSFDNLIVSKIGGSVPYATSFLDDADDGITYSGSWTHRVVEGDSSNNWFRTSSWTTASGTAEFAIDGTGFALVGSNTTARTIGYSIDNGSVVSIQTRASDYHCSFAEVTGLSDGPHTVKITFANNAINFDGLYVIGSSEPLDSLHVKSGPGDIPHIAAKSSDSWEEIEARLPGSVTATSVLDGNVSQVSANAVWTPVDVSGMAYQNVTIYGTASYGGQECPIFATCEVVDPETVIFANFGTDGVLASSASGSVAFDRVKEVMGDKLLNSVSDQASKDGFGYAGAVAAKSGFDQYADKYETMLYGSANSTSSQFTYSLPPLPKYAYKGAIGLKTPWPANSRGVRVVLSSGGVEQELIPRLVLGNNNVTRSLFEFKDIAILDETAPITLTVSVPSGITYAQAPMVSWLELVKDYELDQPFITKFNIGDSIGEIDQSTGEISVTVPASFGSLESIEPEVTVSEGEYLPKGEVDFSKGPVEYTVKRGDGKSKTYSISQNYIRGSGKIRR